VTNLSSLSFYLPELFLIGIILLSIIIELIPGCRKYNYFVVLAGLISVAIMLSWSSTESVSIFMGMSVSDPFAIFFKWIFVIATFYIVLISRADNSLDKRLSGEFNILLLIVMFGLFLMVTANNLIMVYLSIEMVSIASYILAGMLKNDLKSNEASLKYVIFGAFASGLMLYGFSWLYGLSGSTDLHEISAALSGHMDQPFVIYMAILLVLVGIGYKISMVPFHYWTPDVYEGAPTPVTAYLSVAPKAAGIALLIRFFSSTFTTDISTTVSNIDWTTLVAVLSAITMTVGNLLALQQTNIKRLLAFSSIAHAGYMLMVIPVISVDARAAVMIYAVPYLFMNLGLFFMAIAIHNQTSSFEISKWKGLGSRAPLMAGIMVVLLLSLTGLPPTGGFIGKVYLFSVLIKFQQFFWLAVIGVINSVISLFYYFRIVKTMYFSSADDETVFKIHPLLYWSIISCVVPVLLLGIYWSPLINFVQHSISMF
jgi:NADH-quinone oxidoreductase subunit N